MYYSKYNWTIQEKMRSISFLETCKSSDLLWLYLSSLLHILLFTSSVWSLEGFSHSLALCIVRESLSIANSRRVSFSLCMRFYCSVLCSVQNCFHRSFECSSISLLRFSPAFYSIGVKNGLCVRHKHKKVEESDQVDNSIGKTLKLSLSFSLFWYRIECVFITFMCK